MTRRTALRAPAMRATARTAPAARAATSRSRLLALLVAAIAALGLVPAASALTDLRNATGVPYNTIIVSGDAWLGGGGVNIMSNQGRTLTGPWQCVELVNRLYETKGWINPGTWTGNGADKYRTAPRLRAFRMSAPSAEARQTMASPQASSRALARRSDAVRLTG